MTGTTVQELVWETVQARRKYKRINTLKKWNITSRASDFPFQKAIFRFKKSEIPFQFRFIIGNVEFDEITIYRKKVR